MKNIKKIITLSLLAMTMLANLASAKALKIAYSDWPGWVAWELADKKGFFKARGVDVELIWFEYVAQFDALTSGQVDAAGITNGDALLLNATSGTKNVVIMINDFSNGNDKIVGLNGINSVADLKGKKVGVEIGCLSHLLLNNALTKNSMTEADVTLVNMPTHQAAQTLASKEVSAIVAWQPNSGMALETVAGSTEIYTSAQEPGIIFDTLAVSMDSLIKNKAEWEKVVLAWYDVVDYLNDPANKEEAIALMAARCGIAPEKYAKFISGTHFLTIEEALKAFEVGEKLDSVYGSNEYTDKFFIGAKLYDEKQNVKRMIDPSFTKKVAKDKGATEIKKASIIEETRTYSK